MIREKQVPIAEQPPEERIRNFNEVPFGYTEDEAVLEAERCLQCPTAPCVEGCPVGIDIPRFIDHVKNRRFAEAIATIKEANALPAVCGRVCPQESQCQGVCTLGKRFEPVAIGRLERFCADWAAKNGLDADESIPAATGKKVAVIGSGPAGLTAAGELRKMGHAVTVFELLHAPGGVLMYGIPEFRLPKEIVKREIASLERMGVEILVNRVVGRIVTIDQLLVEGYDAVFIGTGAGLPNFMRIPGENLIGVYSANEYLTRVNLMRAFAFPEYDTPVYKSRKAVVLGGGNVAMDAVRTAKRLGAEEATIVYRRSRVEMPARVEEVHHAEEEGIRFHFLTAPTRFLGDDKGRIKAMECIRMELGEPDASGRRRPIPIEGSEFIMEADMAVVAIGNSPNPLIPQTTPGLKVGKWGNLEVNWETMETSMEGVWAGGDIVRGGATVILAMGDARVAARSMDEYLRRHSKARRSRRR